MLTHKAGLGKTCEMYLVGEDGLMRSNSRFSITPTMLQKEVGTEATREAFAPIHYVEKTMTIFGYIIGTITIVYIYLVYRRRNQQRRSESLEESDGSD